MLEFSEGIHLGEYPKITFDRQTDKISCRERRTIIRTSGIASRSASYESENLIIFQKEDKIRKR